MDLCSFDLCGFLLPEFCFEFGTPPPPKKNSNPYAAKTNVPFIWFPSQIKTRLYIPSKPNPSPGESLTFASVSADWVCDQSLILGFISRIAPSSHMNLFILEI